MTAANDILKRNGKSFYFASLVLDRESAEHCARLYTFCRFVDDLADASEDKAAARSRLLDVIDALETGNTSDPVISDFIELAGEAGMSVKPAIDLVHGVLEDLGDVLVRDVAELHRYCYRVAGTVGLLMCGVLNVQDPKACPFAIDLGIGMQLTNIARDVLEDARAGRRYIPASVIGEVAPGELIEPDEEMQGRIADAVCWLLGEADRFYRSGETGLVFLPSRAQLAIRIAARVYHRIGVRLRKGGFAAWTGRTVVALPEKLWVGALAAFVHWKSRAKRRSVPPHTGLLHRWLRHTTSTYS